MCRERDVWASSWMMISKESGLLLKWTFYFTKLHNLVGLIVSAHWWLPSCIWADTKHRSVCQLTSSVFLYSIPGLDINGLGRQNSKSGTPHFVQIVQSSVRIPFLKVGVLSILCFCFSFVYDMSLLLYRWFFSQRFFIKVLYKFASVWTGSENRNCSSKFALGVVDAS